MDLSTVLSSGVVAGLVAGLVTVRTVERKIAIENITQQRQHWRENVRSKCKEVVSAYSEGNASRLTELYSEFQLMLNPEDVNDVSILDTLWEMQGDEKSLGLAVELSEKISLLLKHDWERAKREAKPLWFRIGESQRTSYDNFSHKRGK